MLLHACMLFSIKCLWVMWNMRSLGYFQKFKNEKPFFLRMHADFVVSACMLLSLKCMYVITRCAFIVSFLKFTNEEKFLNFFDHVCLLRLTFYCLKLCS